LFNERVMMVLFTTTKSHTKTDYVNYDQIDCSVCG